MPADILAEMVKDPDRPGFINMQHSALSHPRKYWDKILTSPRFADIKPVELLRLQVVHPGWGNRCDENMDEQE